LLVTVHPYDISVLGLPGLPWQKLHSTRRRPFLPANWT